MVKNIIARIMAVWAILVFITTMLIVWIPAWITSFWPEPKRTIYVFRIFNAWMAFFLIMTGVRKKITGKHHFKKGEAYVVVCNHNSFMDVPLASPAIPGANKTIAKEEMAKIPIFGMVYSRGSVLVNRKSEESRRRSYTKMKEVLQMGLHMCIYPEGTRNKSGEPLQRFHDGAFKLAVETGKSVLPAVIFDTVKVLPTDKTFYFWPHPVEMHFLEPIAVANKTTQQLKEEVFETMKQYYLQHQKL
jgi:1-acyl-sn-glycerol-3-phosphate acyltransferase